MPFDGIVMSAVKKELSESLTGLRIDKVYQPSREEVHLILSRTGVKLRLLLSADSNTARVHLTSSSRENPPSPPVFCMVLRKYLEGGRIAGFSQTGYDRTLCITVDVRDDLGRPSVKQLICEIMGKHSNIILVDPDTGVILDGAKRYSHAVSRHREVLPGKPYIPAPAQGKINPLSLSPDQFFALMLTNPLESRLTDIVQKQFDGLSPRMTREVIHRAGLDPQIILNNCGEIELTSVYIALKDLYARAENGDYQPSLVFSGREALDFAAFELTHLENTSSISGGMNEVADRYFSLRTLTGQMDRTRQSLMSFIKKETGRLEKKLAAQRAELEAAAEAGSLKLSGELITANIHRLQKGETEVYLENFYQEGCPPVKILLDPQLTPVENAQYFFRRYAKAKKVKESATQHSQATRDNLLYMAGVENSVDQASTPGELDEIRSELVDQGCLKPAGPRPAKKKEALPRPSAYTSSDGMTILVGKNNRQNDYLTMKMARQEDIWLHTKDIPGSHVVIRTGWQEVPSTTLEEAASLAALHSRAKQSGKVPVDYTLRKFVSKPKGAKPGYVIYTDQKTIMAEPDPELLEYMEWKKISDALDNVPVEQVSQDEESKAIQLLAKSKKEPRFTADDIDSGGDMYK